MPSPEVSVLDPEATFIPSQREAEEDVPEELVAEINSVMDKPVDTPMVSGYGSDYQGLAPGEFRVLYRRELPSRRLPGGIVLRTVVDDVRLSRRAHIIPTIRLG